MLQGVRIVASSASSDLWADVVRLEKSRHISQSDRTRRVGVIYRSTAEVWRGSLSGQTWDRMCTE